MFCFLTIVESWNETAPICSLLYQLVSAHRVFCTGRILENFVDSCPKIATNFLSFDRFGGILRRTKFQVDWVRCRWRISRWTTLLSLCRGAGRRTFVWKQSGACLGGWGWEEERKNKSHDKTTGFDTTLDQSESSGATEEKREEPPAASLHRSADGPIRTRELTSGLSQFQHAVRSNVSICCLFCLYHFVFGNK